MANSIGRFDRLLYGLVAPLGIAVFGNRVLVSCSPHAFLYTDDDGDDVPDRREVFLTGFGGHDHDHGLHSFVGAPDGSWVFNAGNAGPHAVTSTSGTATTGATMTGPTGTGSGSGDTTGGAEPR